LRFCGIVELPTVPGGTGSSTSANSVFIRVYTSRPILPQVAASSPSRQTFSARWSPMAREGTRIDAMPRCRAIPSCTAGPCAPSEA